MTKPAAMCSRDGPGRDVNSAAPFTRLSEPFFMAQQASHAHDQHVTPACERLGDKLWQRRLAGGLDSEVAALDHLVDGNDRWVVRKFRGQRFCPGAILIRERDEVRIDCFWSSAAAMVRPMAPTPRIPIFSICGVFTLARAYDRSRPSPCARCRPTRALAASTFRASG